MKFDTTTDAATRCTHSVQFYDEDAAFVESLSEFLGSALGSGGACVVIATRKHREAIAERLNNWGLNVVFATQNNRYIALDAAETLANFMVDGWPDESRFHAVIEPVLRSAKIGMRRRSDILVAFGEMVALLWEQGKCEAAVRLEQLWTEFVFRHSFSLRCAYPLGLFSEEAHTVLFGRICAEHSNVIPAESYTGLSSEEERARLVGSLQQKSQILQAVVEAREQEMTQRKLMEERLRRSEEFTRNVVESSVDGVDVLDLEGRLEYMSPPGQRALGIADIAPYLGRPWLELWQEGDRGRAIEAVAMARACPRAGMCALLRPWDAMERLSG
jgi:PAS domain-containing protein